jgi:hypothetical protein
VAVESAGLLLVGGALIFLLGVALPTWRVYVTHDPGARAQLIRKLHTFWVLSHLLFLGGVAGTTVGFAVLATTLEGGRAGLAARLGLAAMVAAGIIWAYIVLAVRLRVAPEAWAREGDGPWAFPAYASLTLLGMILLGVALSSTGYPSWVGILLMFLNGILLVALVVQRDAVPASFYIASLIAGISFLLDGN